MNPNDVDVRPFSPNDAPWLIAENAAHYAASDGFDDTFAGVVGEVVNGFAANHDPDTEQAWIAHHGGRLLGSIFCLRGDAPDVARLKLFYIVEEARGLGLGQRLLETCIAFAKTRGATRLVLRTHESHRAAAALYTKTGFHLVRSIPRHSFGVDVTEQHFELDLT